MNKPNPGGAPSRPSFFSRVSLAFGAFFKIVGNPDYAGRIDKLPAQDAAPQPAAPAAPAEPKPALRILKEASPDAALQLLGMLQRDARLIDFATEDLSAYSDADIGAAARVVHAGCRKVLDQYFTFEPAMPGADGDAVTLAAGFDAQRVRLTGNVAGQPPFRGTLRHHGWVVSSTRLPVQAASVDARVIAAAEVEL